MVCTPAPYPLAAVCRLHCPARHEVVAFTGCICLEQPRTPKRALLANLDKELSSLLPDGETHNTAVPCRLSWLWVPTKGQPAAACGAIQGGWVPAFACSPPPPHSDLLHAATALLEEVSTHQQTRFYTHGWCHVVFWGYICNL